MWACYSGHVDQVDDVAWQQATDVVALRGVAAQLVRAGDRWTATGASGAVVLKVTRGPRTPWWDEPETQSYHGFTWIRWTRTASVAGMWAAAWREAWGLRLDMWRIAAEIQEGRRLEVSLQACPRERAQGLAGYVAEICTVRGQTSVALSDLEWE
jgi:hypothetical protein